MENSSIQYNPGDIEFIQCLIITSQDQVFDLRSLVLEFNIFYDLFSHGVSAQILIADAVGLIDLLPIVGDETLLIQFKTPSLNRSSLSKYNDTITHAFHVYKVSDRDKEAHKFESFILHCVSQEIIANTRTCIDNSFSDMPAESIVEELWEGNFNLTSPDYHLFRTNKTLELAKTDGTMSVVFGGHTALAAIEYIAREAKAKEETESSNFIFYEDNKGHKFTTIDSLMRQKSVEKFYHAFATIEEEKDTLLVGVEQIINSIKMVRQFDVLSNSKEGLYNNTVNIIDPVLKRYREDSFNYEKDFSKIQHITPNKYYSTSSIFSKQACTQKTYSIVSHIDDGKDYRNASEYFIVNDAPRSDHQIRNPRRLHQFLKYNIASRVQLFNIVLEVTVAGNTDLEVGQCVEINISQSSDLKDLKEKLKVLYGTAGNNKFLISSLRHTYNIENNYFFTVIECVKDTYGESPIPLLSKAVRRELAEVDST